MLQTPPQHTHLYCLDLWGLDDGGLGSLDHPVHLNCLAIR